MAAPRKQPDESRDARSDDDEVYSLAPERESTSASSSASNIASGAASAAQPKPALPTPPAITGRGDTINPYEPLKIGGPPVGLPDKCPNCGYSTQGIPTPICPECGKPVRWEDVDYKTLVRASRIDNALYAIGWTLYLGGFAVCYWRIGNPAGLFICCSPLIVLTTVPILLRVFDDTFREFILFCGVLSALWAGFVWALT